MRTTFTLMLVFMLLPALTVCRDRGLPALEVGNLEGMTADDADIPRVLDRLQRLMLLVDQERLVDLPAMVSPDRGVYVDLKSHRKSEDLAREISDPAGYLNLYYLDTAGLRENTGDETQLSVRDVLRTTRTIKVDFFRESEDEIELKLHLVDNMDESYRLNNPVFIREGERWLVYRLF